MTELLGAIALVLVMLAFLLAGRPLRTGSGGLWSAAWAAREAPSVPSAREDVAPRRGVTVLVVDDEPMVRSTSARMLGMLGYDVLEAGSANEALAHLSAAAGEVGGELLDLTMPDCDGMKLFDRIREKLPWLPIVLMSGHGPEEVLERVAGRAHATSLAKPFGLTALEAALAQAFDGA